MHFLSHATLWQELLNICVKKVKHVQKNTKQVEMAREQSVQYEVDRLTQMYPNSIIQKLSTKKHEINDMLNNTSNLYT